LHNLLRYDTITLRLFIDLIALSEDAMSARKPKSPMNFKTIAQLDVPQGRNGKHKQIVTRILSDLDNVAEGVALKVPLAELAESKEKVRSALNRAVHKGARAVATASDTDFLYVWNEIK
jgi:DNA helicase TIP49 (TBP-interacting protein)